MYCVNCGVKLADTENKCPLCQVAVGQPVERKTASPLYPPNRMPYTKINRGAVNGTLLMLWLIPVLVTLFVDLQGDSRIDWFFYAGGALLLFYVTVLLPAWFSKPNPVIFVPCDFAALGAYLFMIDLLTDGGWYWRFALPLTIGLALVVTATVTLFRYVKKGKLYILGGGLMALGVWMFAVEQLMIRTFSVAFTGWSVYPFIALVILGGGLIFLGINATARERMERRFFF